MSTPGHRTKDVLLHKLVTERVVGKGTAVLLPRMLIVKRCANADKPFGK